MSSVRVRLRIERHIRENAQDLPRAERVCFSGEGRQRKFVVACFLPQSEPRCPQFSARRDRAKWFFNRTRSTMGAEGLGCSRQSIDCARWVHARLSMVVVHGCLSPM